MVMHFIDCGHDLVEIVEFFVAKEWCAGVTFLGAPFWGLRWPFVLSMQELPTRELSTLTWSQRMAHFADLDDGDALR